MSHYFIDDKNLKSDIKELRYTFKNNNIIFKSDSGVFSREHIDFGTNVLLNSLEDLNNIKSVLDVGCGYGIIGLSIAKAYQNIDVQMIDINEKAVLLADINRRYNEINNAKVCQSNLYENVNGKYDLIISNPPIRAGKKVVFAIVEEGKDFLNDNGIIYVVIQKKQGAPSLYNKMMEVYKNVEIITKEKGYFIIKSVKSC